MKKIIVCPDCQEKGLKQSLAEVLDDGSISVMRNRSSTNKKDHTIIGGTHLFVKCGECKHVVYKRET